MEIWLWIIGVVAVVAVAVVLVDRRRGSIAKDSTSSAPRPPVTKTGLQ
jgi:hypothetical protein